MGNRAVMLIWILAAQSLFLVKRIVVNNNSSSISSSFYYSRLASNFVVTPQHMIEVFPLFSGSAVPGPKDTTLNPSRLSSSDTRRDLQP